MVTTRERWPKDELACAALSAQTFQTCYSLHIAQWVHRISAVQLYVYVTFGHSLCANQDRSMEMDRSPKPDMDYTLVLYSCRPRIGISDSYRPYTEVYSRNPETRAEKDSYTTHYTLAHSYIKLYTPQNIAAAVITNRKRSVGLADPKFVPDIVHLSPGTSPASSPGSSLHGACCMLTIAFQL